MKRHLENPTYQLVQAMIRGERCGMCGRRDLKGTDYAVRDGRIVDVPRRLVPRLCTLCECEFRSYRRGPSPRALHEIGAPFLADALAAIVRPSGFTLFDYAAVTPEQWHTLAAGYLIVQEFRRRADDCMRRMNAASAAKVA
jgi:hypothetical protein